MVVTKQMILLEGKYAKRLFSGIISNVRTYDL
jgi:hypothetical protein